MKKRLLSIILALSMLLCLAPATVLADSTSSPYDITGEGTAENPYLIYTAAGLKAFRDKVNGQNGLTKQPGVYAKLMNDIVLNDGTFDENGNWSESGTPNKWTPIGGYSGTFDGDGHTVKGLYVTGAEKAGLFGSISSAAIKNVTVDGFVEGTEHVGGIVGYISSPYIENCVNLCRVATTAMSAAAGGIAGFSDAGKILSCANLGTVSVSPGDDQPAYTGGIVGGASDTTVSDCYNAGKVMSLGGRSEDSIGGIVGAAATAKITNCYNVGRVSKESVSLRCRIGGIAGYQSNRGTISNCYWLSDTADAVVGKSDGGTQAGVAIKTKSDFADGTVLELLKNNRTDSPWTKTGYVSASDMVLPMFSWQTADSMDITGTGGVDDPYLIYTAEGLKAFQDAVNNHNHGGAHAKLMNDIVLNDGTFDADGNYTKGASGKDAERWTPIVNYTGTFDGNGNTIKGLYVTTDYDGDFIGLFSVVDSGTVKNLAVTGYVVGHAYFSGASGGIVGCANNGAIIEGCVNMCRVTVRSYISSAGGIAGEVRNSFIKNCINLGEISGLDDNSVSVGGIVGMLLFRDMMITDCYNAGHVTNGGGIAGMVFLDDKIANSYYLIGTATKDVGDVQESYTEPKSRAEFADGTVLELLKNGRTDSPWTKIGYLEAAGMTLPLLNWQTADNHNHNYEFKYNDTEHWKECSCGVIESDSRAAHSEETGVCTDGIKCECGYEMHSATSGHNWSSWQHLTTSHTRGCLNPGCGITQSRNCSGGTATCTEQAVCEVCGEHYGALDSNNHSYEWQNENGFYWQHCRACGADTEKTAVPQIIINAPDKVCRAQDFKFSFTLPENITDVHYGYEFIGLGDSGLAADFENGVYSGAIKAAAYPSAENRFKLVVHATTPEGFYFTVEKTVDILDEHIGGTATCTEQAVCEVCGESYGELDHDNHSDLQHFAAKPATETEEGNIEYWYCSGCGKYFFDSSCEREISKADTVTAKLEKKKAENKDTAPKADNSTKSSDTGNDYHLVVWCALLFAGSILCIIILKRKKNITDNI